jgi:UDP:flavonoid glycosyltransferase YjiC (YdhE family)
MRVLVTSSAMVGHFAPLVPLIEALRGGGDDVLLVAPEPVRERAESLGVPLRVGGSPDPAEADLLWRRFRSAGPQEASVIANREIFGRLNTAAMLPSVEQAVADHRPEIVLHETTEYAGPLTAVRAGIGHAQVALSLAAVEHGSLTVATPALERYGPIVAALQAAPYLTRFPAQVDPSPYADTRRYREPARVPRPLPDWWGGSRDPLVYVTFGTVAGALGTGAYRAAVEALENLQVRVLITTGQQVNLGPMPAHIHVRRWVDQEDVLAEASAVLCHGGSGTSLGALAAGVPMVIYPLFADQGANARALENLGVALVVEPTGISAAERATYDPRTVGVLRGAVERVLQNGPPRAAARAVAAELGRRPTPAQLLPRLSAR